MVRLRADEFPVYCLAVAGCVFSALLVDLKDPSVARIPGKPTLSWPYHIQNLTTVSDFHTGILASCLDSNAISQHCAYCASCQTTNIAGERPHPGLRKLKVPSKKAALVITLSCNACVSAFNSHPCHVSRDTYLGERVEYPMSFAL